MCKVNPKVDFAFKKLFGSEENKDILMAFINSILSKDQQITDLKLKNPYNLSNYLKGKMSILDIKAVDENGVWYDIEMQMAEQEFYDKRAFYYWSKVYSDQIEEGFNYDKLKKTIGINILDFNYIDEEDYHNVYKVYNEKSHKEFSDIFEMHFIELSKFNKDYKDIKTALERWVTFLNRAYELDKDKMPETLLDEKIIKAVEKINVMYLNKEEREFYENDLKAMMVRDAEIKTAERKGREEGREKGREEGREEVAIEAMKSGLDINLVAKISKVSLKKVKELKVKYNL